MKTKDYPALGAGTTGRHGHADRRGVLLDAQAAAEKLRADSVRRRRRGSPLAVDYSRILFPIIDPYDWGTRAFFYAESATNDRWNDWKLNGRRGDNAGLPYWRIAPRRLQIWRLDHHTRPGHRTPEEKLLVTAGRREGRIIAPLLDLDAHEGEPDAYESFVALRDKYFSAQLYHEEAEQGWHGYPLFDRLGYSDADVNDILHRTHLALGILNRTAGREAMAEFKGSITEVDARGCVTVRGGLCAPPRLPNGYSSLDAYKASPLYAMTILERIIDDAARVTRKPRASHVAETPVASTTRHCGGSVYRFVPSTNDPHDLKLEVTLWLARQLGRVPTPDEVHDLYDPLRDHPSDAARRRKIEATIEFVARTFRASKCGRRNPVGPWAANEKRLVALVEEYVDAAAYDRAGIPQSRRGIPAVELAMVLHSLEQKSYAKEPKPDDQFTWGVDFIESVVRGLNPSGEALRRQTTSDARRVLEASGLAECFDPDYFATWGGLRGRCRKYHIGPAHPGYANFCRWVEDNSIPTTKMRDSRPRRAPSQKRGT